MDLGNSQSRLRLVLLTALALIAFAGNSVLCRMALKDVLIDAGTFTAIRLLTGTVALLVFVTLRGNKGQIWREGSWWGGGFLAVYMVGFSWAYLRLETGAGALVLFGAVQVTMVGFAVAKRERLSLMQVLGLFIALGGLAWLLVPGTKAPSLGAGALMALAGVAWGAYTLRGRGALDPLGETAGNFMKASPLALIVVAWSWGALSWTYQGVLLAVISGVVTSAAGYAIWYEALRGLSSTRAAALQLLVPVLAAVGGLLFGAEVLTMRFLLSSVLVLGGIIFVIVGKRSKVDSLEKASDTR